MKFSYIGRNAQGSEVRGSVDAQNKDSAQLVLLQQGIMLDSLEETDGGDIDVEALFQKLFPEKISIEELIMFCRQMSSMARAGVPLIRALKGIVDSLTNQRLAGIIRDVTTSVEGGNALATALNNHSKVFGPIFISMIRVGENTGKLDEALNQVAFYLDLERETKKRIKQATRYPTMVVLAISVAMVVVNIFVIPAFSKVFAQIGSDLPIATKILLGTSGFMVNYWWLLLGLIAGGGIWIRYYVNTPEGRFLWDKSKLRIPLLGMVFQKIILARFSRVFSMLSSAGVPILSALQNVAQAVGNAYIASKIMEMHNGIERGDSFTRTSKNTQVFSTLVLQMIAVGEETGNLDEMLIEVAKFYEEDTDYNLKKLGDAIEPILLVAMGFMVLVLALGIFLPMWNLGAASQSG